MKLVTAEQMRRVDAAAIAGGIASLELMERAGEGLAACVRRLVAAPVTVGVVLGAGNNAGDGLVAARHLAAWGYRLVLFCTTSEQKLSPDARANRARLVPGSFVETDAITATVEDFAQCACLIDALLGTGLNAPVRAPLREVIDRMNQSGVRVVAADLPSGLSADTGAPLGIAVRAHTTVTFGLPKVGLVLPPAADCVGRLEVVDIGLPRAVMDAVISPYQLNGPDLFLSQWPQRRAESHKGDYGHVLVIAGSRGMIGAGFLAARAALRVGAGLVTYALPEGAYAKFDPQAAEVMMLPLPDDGTGTLTPAATETITRQLAGARAVALGPGLGRSPATAQMIQTLLAHVSVPTVVDADALNALAEDRAVLQHRRAARLLTPHPGEMARLGGTTTAAIAADRLGTARACAQQHGALVVLKGHRTVMATPDGALVINATGNAGMATAGSGDVLTGVLAGLLAQGMDPPAAMTAGVYLHGLAGDLAAARSGEQGMIASDLIDHLPAAIQRVRVSAPDPG